MRYKAPAQLLTKYRSRFSRRSGLGSGSLLLDMYGTDAAAAYALVDLGNRRGSVTETGESVFYEEYSAINASNNGGFETALNATTDWRTSTLGSSTLTRITTDFDTGVACIEMQLDGSGSLAALLHDGYGTITSGEEVQWSFRAKRTAGSDNIAVGTNNDGAGGTQVLTSDWATYSGTFTVVNTGSFSLKRSAALPNSRILIDNVQVEILNKTVTEDVTYHNPVVRVRRDSDGIFRSFSASEVKNGTMLAWVNQRALPAVQYNAAYFGGANFIETGMKLDPSSDPTVSFTVLLSTFNNNVIISDRSTERFVACFVDTDGQLRWETQDSSGYLATIIGTLDLHTPHDIVATYSSASSQWSVTIDGGSPVTHTHAGSFTLINLNSIILGDGGNGAGNNLVGSIYDIDLDGISAYAGNGTSAGAWADTIGSNDGTIQGTLAAYNYQGVTGVVSTLYDQSGVEVVSTLVDATTNNGGFETAGGGGADVFANWSESASGTSTVNRDTSDFDTGTASCRLDIDASNSNAQVALASTLSNGDVIQYSIRAKGSNSGDRLSVGGTLTGDSDTVTVTTEWATYTGIVIISNGSTTFAVKRFAAASQSLWVDNLEVQFLNKNHNDATQSTVASMPKIVSAGALVTDANGNAALDFDGTDDKLDTPSLITSIGTAASFVIGQTVSSGGQIPLSLSTGTIRWFAPYDNGSRFDFSYAAAVNAITGANRDDNLHLWTMTAGSGGVEAFQDGVSQGTTAQSTGFTDVGDDEIMGNIICEGKITAILAYSADKSASRSAIESALSKVITTALS